MFLFRAGRYLEELKKFRPDILAACEQAMRGVDPDLDFIRVDEEAFLACPEESIDYAVMERTADAVVMPMDAGWSDVGSWSSLWEISAHTPEGNVHHGDVISHKTENSYVYAESGLGDHRRREGSGGGADQRRRADCRSPRGAGREKGGGEDQGRRTP